MHIGGGVHAIHHSFDFLLRGIGGQMLVMRDHAQLFAVAMLHGHIVGRRPVVSHQHCAEAGHDALLPQSVYSALQLSLYLGCQLFPV